MDTAVLREIESLRRASMADLRKKYQEVFQEQTRCKHREHLFRRIAWRLQALAEGDLSERARGRAHQIAQDGDLRINAPRDFFTVGQDQARGSPFQLRSDVGSWRGACIRDRSPSSRLRARPLLSCGTESTHIAPAKSTR